MMRKPNYFRWTLGPDDGMASLHQPPRTLAGSVNKALMKRKNAFTVMPISLNGSIKSQTIGKRSKARIATGQHISSKSSHKINFTNIVSFHKTIRPKSPKSSF